MPARELIGKNLWLVVLLATGASYLEAAPQGVTPASVERTFLGADDKPLPFKNDEEVLNFLRDAEVVEENEIGTGINRSLKVLLEKDGVRANGIFRETDKSDPDIRVGGINYRLFRDSYLFEPAAYHLALQLGITSIPPVVRREVDSRDGSVQIWIEETLDEESKGFTPPDISAWIRQLRDMFLFDAFIYNPDRNGGNILVTPDYKLIMIDHTRGFQEKRDVLDPDHLNLVNSGTWERFQSLTDEEIRDAVRPYLTPQEMTQLVVRRKTIIEYVNGLIAQRGRDGVVIP